MSSWIIALLGLLSGPVWAAGVHQHGVARLEGALDGEQLELVLTSPLDALVGFERAPRNADERARLAAMSTALRDGAKVIRLTESAQCALIDVSLASPVLSSAGAKLEDHVDLTARYRYRCARAQALHELGTGVFELFPRVRKIELQWAGPSGQRAATLTPKAPRMMW